MKILVIIQTFILIVMGGSYAQAQRDDTAIVVHFATNSFLINDFEQQKLSSFFKVNNAVKILNIEGHADTVGNAKNNLSLSQYRANAVAVWVKSHGHSEDQFELHGFGEARPADPNNNSVNRRVKIGISFNESHDRGDVLPPGTLIKKYSFDKMYFEPDKPVLESFSRGYVEVIARMLKTYRSARFEIRGHVNCALNVDVHSDYMEKMNRLSLNRAKAIYEMLIDRGLPPERMSYKGMGNKEMIFPHASTEEEMRKNMRVEILVIKDSL